MKQNRQQGFDRKWSMSAGSHYPILTWRDWGKPRDTLRYLCPSCFTPLAT